MNKARFLREKYPDKVPVICTASGEIKQLKKNKFLVPADFNISQFLCIIRRRIKLPPSAGLFIFIDGKIPPLNEPLYMVYEKYKKEDEFLYITYAQENMFG